MGQDARASSIYLSQLRQLAQFLPQIRRERDRLLYGEGLDLAKRKRKGQPHGHQFRTARRQTKTRKQRLALSNDFLHGLSPEEFHKEAEALAAMTSAARARLKAQLIERLKTPVDEPSWGPDWVRQGERVAAQQPKGEGFFARTFSSARKRTRTRRKRRPSPPL